MSKTFHIRCHKRHGGKEPSAEKVLKCGSVKLVCLDSKHRVSSLHGRNEEVKAGVCADNRHGISRRVNLAHG